MKYVGGKAKIQRTKESIYFEYDNMKTKHLPIDY